MCGGLLLPFAGPKGDLRSTSYASPSRYARACWIISTFKSKEERGRAFSDDVTANLIFLFSFHASILGPLMFKYRGSVYFEISYSCYWRRLHHRILINELLILVHDIIYISNAVSSEMFLACFCVLLCILLQLAQWPLWKLWLTSCNNFVRHRCKFNKGPHAHLWFVIFLSCLPCPRLRKQLVRTAFWMEVRTEIRQVGTTLEQSRNLKGGRLKLMPSFVRCYSSWM